MSYDALGFPRHRRKSMTYSPFTGATPDTRHSALHFDPLSYFCPVRGRAIPDSRRLVPACRFLLVSAKMMDNYSGGEGATELTATNDVSRSF
ncbi:hypothetical protein CGRA01v4_06571 [Colletotrichum graminicola]|nr:hypothetical protein CGRA01v4_06571 [Colletotrichum graminicola]